MAGIIGWPISHSLSPVMHNAAFAALGLDWIFVPFPVDPARLAEGVAGLRALGVKGFNVTIPHKVAVMPLLDEISADAELIGAVNVVALKGGRLVGYNTDGIGLLAALSGKLGFDPRGRSVLVLGAGGAARSAVAALSRAGALRVEVANRSAQKGEELAAAFAARFPGTSFRAESLSRLCDPGYLEGFDLLVNTTSVGMKDDSFPGLSFARVRERFCVYDMVYAPPLTPLLALAAAHGIPGANGIGMLVAQGEAAFSIWTEMEAPAGCMEHALHALGVGVSP